MKIVFHLDCFRWIVKQQVGGNTENAGIPVEYYRIMQTALFKILVWIATLIHTTVLLLSLCCFVSFKEKATLVPFFANLFPCPWQSVLSLANFPPNLIDKLKCSSDSHCFALWLRCISRNWEVFCTIYYLDLTWSENHDEFHNKNSNSRANDWSPNAISSWLICKPKEIYCFFMHMSCDMQQNWDKYRCLRKSSLYFPYLCLKNIAYRGHSD